MRWGRIVLVIRRAVEKRPRLTQALLPTAEPARVVREDGRGPADRVVVVAVVLGVPLVRVERQRLVVGRVVLPPAAALGRARGGGRGLGVRVRGAAGRHEAGVLR